MFTEADLFDWLHYVTYQYWWLCYKNVPTWACEKVASNFGLGDGFRRVLRFPPPFTWPQYRTKSDKKQNSNLQECPPADIKRV